MTDIRLSEHFMLSEFTRSSTAERLGICNELDPFYPTHKDIIANLRNLCEQVLEPLRAYVRQPIIISSGYRSPALNQALRGAPRSQHLTGEAADIRLPTYNCRGADGQSFTNLEQLNKRFLWLMNNTDFDHYQNLNLIKSRVCGKYSTDCVSREVLIIMFDNNICSHEQRPA